MALASAFPAGPQARVRPGARSAGEVRDQPGRAHQLGQASKESADLAGNQLGRAQELGRAQRGWPVKQELSRIARTSSAVPEGGEADLAGDQLGTCGLGRMGPHGEKPHHGQDHTGRRRPGNPGRTKEEAPPRMRWRGPSDPAAPDTAISCSASVPPDQPPSRRPARSPSCPVPLASGVPPGWFRFRQ
jgi:hypothetical protein